MLQTDVMVDRMTHPEIVARPAIPEASRRRLDDTVERLRGLLPADWNVTVAHRQPDLGIISIADDDGTEATVSSKLARDALPLGCCPWTRTGSARPRQRPGITA